ncbi:hypothetical protein G6N82_10700 [Altererythrobacter sp. BO-6]|nr:hypothetical protein G6N82_10700 [Altererythrobacter sp. BO-6]
MGISEQSYYRWRKEYGGRPRAGALLAYLRLSQHSKSSR